MVASKDDEKWMNAEFVYDMLDKVLGKHRWILIRGSAEKNPIENAEFCEKLRNLEVEIVITCAGLFPMIGRAAASYFAYATPFMEGTVVMCVPETAEHIPSLLSTPDFVAVSCPGHGKRGFLNAAVLACQSLSRSDRSILVRLGHFRDEFLKTKQQPQFDVRGTLDEQQPRALAAAAPIPED
ncbi:MAG: hypothetical protein A3C85_02800 [Candidatus Doudnabacteria bacterium RIFCSPHIGHO2_02_FULL_48_21]|uniref:PurE domain-containing protein n=1 Tax=Candidatus Doudnabacteria bacterium RIFCSPLOWO2_02_FULL_48_13 TaxID=1817845 RepID=A0A1F5Q9R5_9BACT|nr:MAG: hypothetical protein A3K05_03445 [Candidatus Doudnabacteria bacterium RIFCSPHIGHO2_01_48_18]OGE92884.1 MAG: hypothetical protein A3C85_02800 [Candidatus Doudnabacteria bacterium RIFCSPHIGHO2_02_FULL_48_21]OGE98878.1 MAG: hypothetical protein A3J05_03245 [Candidatus Doudnabacteria bacterium RIFCSPLOWO2_02_FULL_48_13]OGF01378.1 MAG: hypothetical protein A3G07_03585 [Candidatus Doudnabacteria bacterium RIFCSPLOWO2_12_FULL_47_12]